jgi:hypothetical protein
LLQGSIGNAPDKRIIQSSRIERCNYEFCEGRIIEMSVNGPLGGNSEGEMNLVEEETKNDG